MATEINRTDIPQNILNIEARTRTNLFAWNGQFSPQFIEAVLSAYADDNDFVVDPFAGSGTVIGECARKNIACYGTEINAPAFLMAKIYEASNMNKPARTSLIRAIDDFILYTCMNGGDITASIIAEIRKSPGTMYADVLSALIVIMDMDNHTVTPDILSAKWSRLGKIIAGIPYCERKISIARRDARDSGLDDDAADLLITSPPYINVFNYHQKYRRSAEALGYDVLRTAGSEIGSNRKNRGNRFLTVIQYCVDMAGAISEASRICREGARMIYIVGRESRVMGVPLCNSELIYDIGTEILGLGFMMRQERFFKNRFGQVIYEDILHFRNTKGRAGNIIDGAREIAVRMLEGKLKDSDGMTRELLSEAISRKDSVMPSEVFRP